MMTRLHNFLSLNAVQLILLVALVGFFLLTTYLMLIELPPKKMGWPHWDKVQHMLVFLMLTGLALCLYFQQRWQWAAGLFFYGGLIEWMQATLTITRMASIGDWVADFVGILIAIAASIALNNLRLKNTILLGAN